MRTEVLMLKHAHFLHHNVKLILQMMEKNIHLKKKKKLAKIKKRAQSPWTHWPQRARASYAHVRSRSQRAGAHTEELMVLSSAILSARRAVRRAACVFVARLPRSSGATERCAHPGQSCQSCPVCLACACLSVCVRARVRLRVYRLKRAALRRKSKGKLSPPSIMAAGVF